MAARARMFLWLLAGILAVYALIVTFGDHLVSSSLRTAVLGLILIGALRLRRRRLGLGLTVTGVLVALMLVLTPLAGALGATTLADAAAAMETVVLVAAAIVTIARTTIETRVIDGAAVLAVLSIYLQLALLFAGLHQLAAAVSGPGYVNGVNGVPDIGDLLYLSVITLATVGYGDLTPATDIGRTIAITEALVGQLYLVSVVAGVVAGWRRPG